MTPSRVLFAAALTISSVTTGLTAQHFEMPDDPDTSAGLLIGEPCGSIGRPTTSFGSAVSDGWLYVIGGYSGRPHDYHRDGQSREFYRVNLFDLGHQEQLPNAQQMQSCPLEAWEGRIIRTGGLVADNAPGEPALLRSMTSVESYDPSSRTWTALPDMPAGRSSHDTAVVGSKLHVFGGWGLDSETKQRDWFEDVWTLDLANPDAGWVATDAPFKRRALATVAIGDKVLAMGGMTPDGASNRVDIFDTTTGTWSEGPDYPAQAFGLAAEHVDGRIIASGSSGELYAWAPGDATWTQIGALTFPRFFHQMARNEQGDVLAIGGISRGMRPSHIERVALGSDQQPTDAMVRHWTIPTPSAAKNRQAFFIRDGWIYMFGGNNSTGQHDFESDNFLAEGWKMNLATMSWRPCSDYPMPRQSIQTLMAADGSSGYSLGGFGWQDDSARTHVEGCTYDFKENEWTVTGPHLPVSRSQFGLTSHGDEYWVFGGLDYDPRREQGDQFRHLDEVMVANRNGGDVAFEDSGIRLPNTRRAFGAATIDDRYYMIGGMTDNFQLVPSCDVFDFSDKTWHEMPAPERTRLSPEAVVLGKHIFVVGGMSPSVDGEGLEPNKSLEMFDTESGTWTTVMEELPFALRHIRMMPYRGQLLIFTSHESEANMAHVVLINPYRMMPNAPTGSNVAMTDDS